MREDEVKPGDLVFLKTDMADLLYVVKELEGRDVVIARKLDAPPKQLDRLAIKNCVKLSEGQEKLMPDFLLEVVKRQRKEIFPKKGREKDGGKKKQMSLFEALGELPDDKLEEVYAIFRD